MFTKSETSKILGELNNNIIVFLSAELDQAEFRTLSSLICGILQGPELGPLSLFVIINDH